jgi:hypothetical protein
MSKDKGSSLFAESVIDRGEEKNIEQHCCQIFSSSLKNKLERLSVKSKAGTIKEGLARRTLYLIFAQASEMKKNV